jgi:hypothetical protein
MKKPMSDIFAHPIHPVEMAAHVLALLALTFYATPYLLQVNQLWVMAVAIYLTVAASTITLLQGRSSLLLRSSVRAVTFVIISVLLLLAFAVWQDVQHIPCIGLFGATTSCFNYWAFWSFVMVFASPIALLLLVTVICMGAGLYETNKSLAKNNPRTKRTP